MSSNSQQRLSNIKFHLSVLNHTEELSSGTAH